MEEHQHNETYHYHPGLAQLPIYGLGRIGILFHSGKDAVLQWYREGAPIWKAKKTYIAEFSMLFDWLVERQQKAMQLAKECQKSGN